MPAPQFEIAGGRLTNSQHIPQRGRTHGRRDEAAMNREVPSSSRRIDFRRRHHRGRGRLSKHSCFLSEARNCHHPRGRIDLRRHLATSQPPTSTVMKLIAAPLWVRATVLLREGDSVAVRSKLLTRRRQRYGAGLLSSGHALRQAPSGAHVVGTGTVRLPCFGDARDAALI